uniref:Thyroglobulin type-1 domain-containing protein n=1 Tax=Astyanax mexicanus TaxID=7994 RepID=A0A3B1IPG4_ASTMX
MHRVIYSTILKVSIGAFVPECDEQGQYRPQQCHGSTGHCWCVDSRGQERQGTRTPPGTSPYNCDAPGKHTSRISTYSIMSLHAVVFYTWQP